MNDLQRPTVPVQTKTEEEEAGRVVATLPVSCSEALKCVTNRYGFVFVQVVPEAWTLEPINVAAYKLRVNNSLQVGPRSHQASMPGPFPKMT
eukprot:g49338.t1